MEFGVEFVRAAIFREMDTKILTVRSTQMDDVGNRQPLMLTSINRSVEGENVDFLKVTEESGRSGAVGDKQAGEAL
jgi:hypothetical protein